MTTNDEALAELKQAHPEWQIWRVDRHIGGPVWCARPLGQTKPVLNAYDPTALRKQIDWRDAAQPGAVPDGEAAVPYGEALRRMQAAAAELSAAGMTTYLHDSREEMYLTARFCPPGERETEIVFDEDGYTEVRYWVSADAEADEITALALRVLAAFTSTTNGKEPEATPPADPETAAAPEAPSKM